MIDTIRSKKLWFSAGAVLVLFGFAVVSIRWDALRPLFSTFCDAVVAISALYLTGNVANKWVAAKADAAKPGAKKPPQPPGDPEPGA